MLAGVMVHEDGQVALERGLVGQQFFKWALAHYYRFGAHVPGRTDLWAEFQAAEREPMAGVGAVGDPDQARAHFRELEDAGVDQVILLQQGGDYAHEHICESLELLGTAVLPEFLEREPARRKAKEARLGGAVDAALGTSSRRPTSTHPSSSPTRACGAPRRHRRPDRPQARPRQRGPVAAPRRPDHGRGVMSEACRAVAARPAAQQQEGKR